MTDQYSLCPCGCGQPVIPSKKGRRKFATHQCRAKQWAATYKRPQRKWKPRALEQSAYLCECGCGKLTHLVPFNSKRMGYVKGEPMRFLAGHYVRTEAFRQIHKEARATAKMPKGRQHAAFGGDQIWSEGRGG
jgi:hypothetical protein